MVSKVHSPVVAEVHPPHVELGGIDGYRVEVIHEHEAGVGVHEAQEQAGGGGGERLNRVPSEVALGRGEVVPGADPP